MMMDPQSGGNDLQFNPSLIVHFLNPLLLLLRFLPQHHHQPVNTIY